MTVAQLKNFQREIASAEKIVMQRKMDAAEAAEISTEDLLASLKRELRSVSVAGWGKVFYYYPLSIEEYLALQARTSADGSMTATGIAQTIVDLARKGDGTPKFTAEHVGMLTQAAPDRLTRLAKAVVQLYNVRAESLEKK